MSIEIELKREFRKSAEAMKCPKHFDVHVHTLYRNYMERKSVAFRRFTFTGKTLRTAAIALLVVVLAGFIYGSTQLLFKTSTQNINIELAADSKLVLKHTSGKAIRQSLDDVRRQLAVGESAIVYFTDLAKEDYPLFRKYPILPVSNPYLYSDLEQWTTLLSERNLVFKQPSHLPASYTFAGGKQELPLGGTITPTSYGLIGELRKNAEETGNSVVWRKIALDAATIPAFTSIYKNDHQEEIYVSMQVVPATNVDIRGLTGNQTTSENVKVNERDAFYTNNNNQMLSKTDVYQDLVWLESEHDRTIVYRVSSGSLTVTKDELLQIAQSMR
jgi:hypothetical protein